MGGGDRGLLRMGVTFWSAGGFRSLEGLGMTGGRRLAVSGEG